MPVDLSSYMVGRTDEKYYELVLTIDACGQAFSPEGRLIVIPFDINGLAKINPGLKHMCQHEN